MKRVRLCVALAAVVAVGALAGCNTTQQANMQTTLSNLNQTNLLALQTISNGCKIVQPTLQAAAPANANIAAAAGVNAVICATADVATASASAVVAAQPPVAAPVVAPAASAPAPASQ